MFFPKITTSLSAIVLCVGFASASLAALIEDSLEFPMTIWGLLMDDDNVVSAGAVVSFINLDSGGNFKISGLTTTVAGKFGGDSAYDINIALSEFTGELVLQVSADGQTFTLAGDDLTAADSNPAGCPATDALGFVSETCQYNIDISEASIIDLDLIPMGATFSNGSAVFSGDTVIHGSADLNVAGSDSFTVSGGNLTVHSSVKSDNLMKIFAGTTIIVADGTWSGKLSPPAIVSQSGGTIVFTAGDSVAKLDFGISPAFVQIKIDGSCNSSGYTVNRKSFGESSPSTAGVTNITTTTSGDDCLLSFYSRYFSEFTVAVSVNSDSSSSEGGRGGSTGRTTLIVEDENEEEFELQSVGVASPFIDIDGHWAADFIDSLRLAGVIDSKSVGIFSPNAELTRAELIKIVVNLYGIEVPTEVTTQPFSDIKIDEWYAPFVAAVKIAGIVDGYDNNTFRPNNPVSRVEALKIILGVTGFEIAGGEMNFPDTELGQWYEKYVAFAVLHELMSGYENGNFGPGNSMTRAQFAKVAMLSLDITELQ